MEINTYVEVRNNGIWGMVEQPTFSHPYLEGLVDAPFSWLSTALVAFLGGFGLNGSKEIKPISPPKGFPFDVSRYVSNEYTDADGLSHSMSYVSLKELIEFDYSSFYRDALGECFFKNIEELNALGEPESVRVVFWFDDI